MRQILRDTEPKTPSTRVSVLDAEMCSKVAMSCQSDVVTLRRKLRGDLDWITLKAMEKDRMRRYQTAHALAEDIERHLNNEPVLAGRPGALYRFQKLVRRNQGVFAAVAAVATVLALGVLVSTWQAVRATRAEHTQTRLRHEAETARQEETAQRRKAEALTYASDMSLAQQALAIDDLGRARRLLEAHRPGPGQVDLRGWEWRYLWQECRSDAISELCRYPGSSFSVAYSPNGNMLAVAGIMGEFVEIWDVPAHKRITTLQPKEGHLVAFSPRGGLLATDAGNQVRLWRTGPWNLVGQLAVPGRVGVLKFSPDGTRLASLSYPDEVTVWEVAQWAVIRKIHGARRAGYFEGRLDFSPDSKALVIGDAHGQLRVVDLTSGNTDVNIPEAHSEGITCVAWSPNGSIIASGSGYSGGPISLWDAASGQPLGSLEGHNSLICKLIFSTDGQRLYSASADQTIRIWDVGQRGCLATLRGSTDEVYGLALSPDGTTLASASKDGIVALWSALPRSQEESPRLIPLDRFWRPAFAPDSRVLAAPRAGTISLFDLATLREIEQFPAMGTDGVTAVAYSPDETLLVSGSRSGKIRVWSCAERRLLRELDGHKESILMFRFHADSTRLLSIDAKGNVILWDTLTWQPARTFVRELTGVGDVSPDGRLVAMDAAGAMRWQNAETGELLAKTTGGHRRGARGVVFSGDGSRVASVATDGTVALWDPSSFQLIAAFKGHMNAAQAAAFSPDGRRLATGGGSRDAVKLWDLSTHRELLTLTGQGSGFSFVDFSPDGRWLAAANSEGKLHLWRAPSWEEIEAAEKKAESRQSK